LLLGCDRTDTAAAESSLRTAIDVAREQPARLSELQATMSLARLLAPWFTEGFDTADLKDAKALLEKLRR
jgi:hypothetical protein